jgi:type III secretory pathway component EscS
MDVLILVIMITGTLLAIASGVWVAIALVNAISAHQEQTNKEKTTPQ